MGVGRGTPIPRLMDLQLSPPSLKVASRKDEGDGKVGRGSVQGENNHPEAFDSHVHLDRSLTKYSLPKSTSLGSYLRLPLFPFPREPVQLVGGVVVFCDPPTWPKGPLVLEPGWKIAVGVHPKKSVQLQDSRRAELDTLLSRSDVSALGEIGVHRYDVPPQVWQGQLDCLKWVLNSSHPSMLVILHARGEKTDKLSAKANADVLGAMLERCPNSQ